MNTFQTNFKSSTNLDEIETLGEVGAAAPGGLEDGVEDGEGGPDPRRHHLLVQLPGSLALANGRGPWGSE